MLSKIDALIMKNFFKLVEKTKKIDYFYYLQDNSFINCLNQYKQDKVCALEMDNLIHLRNKINKSVQFFSSCIWIIDLEKYIVLLTK